MPASFIILIAPSRGAVLSIVVVPICQALASFAGSNLVFMSNMVDLSFPNQPTRPGVLPKWRLLT